MLIGTHNSSAYQLDFKVSFWKPFSKWNFLRLAARWLPCVGSRVKALTCNQSLDILGQLRAGARILDLYLSFAGQLYCSHTFASIPFQSALNQISAFGNECSDNIMILLCVDYENQSTITLELEEKLAPKLLAVKNVVWFWQPKHAVFVDSPALKHLDSIQLDWFNVDNVTDFLGKFNEQKYDAAAEHGLCCILTPQADKGLLYESLRAMAAELNATMLPLIARLPAASRPKYVLVDYFSSECVLV